MMKLERLFDGVRVADEILAKATGVSDLAQMARIESTLRDYLHAQWKKTSTKAAQDAAKLVRGSGNPTKADVERVTSRVRATMKAWPVLVSRRLKTDLEQIYRLARKVGRQKAHGRIRSKLTYHAPVLKAEGDPKTEITPTFDAVDEKAIEALGEQSLFWIGEHYGEDVEDAVVQSVTETMLEQGLDRAEAGRKLEGAIEDALEEITMPDAFKGSAEDYFSGFAANVTTVARNYGQMKSFDEADVEVYVIVNPDDEKTCDRCEHMEDKEFPVQSGMNQMLSEIGLDDPEDMQDVHPWLSIGAILKIGGAGPTKDDSDFAEAGLSMPPFHFHCRCTVDIADKS